MPTNAKSSVYKEKEFETYVLWKSVPAYFRGMKKEQLISHGYTDPLIIKLIMIKNQTHFAKVFRIKDLGTLTDWNNKINNDSLLQNKFKNIFNEQNTKVLQTTEAEPTLILENTIAELRKQVNTLKRENAFFRKQLGDRKIKQFRVSAKNVQSEILRVETPTAPLAASETIEETSFFARVKNIVSMWRDKK